LPPRRAWRSADPAPGTTLADQHYTFTLRGEPASVDQNLFRFREPGSARGLKRIEELARRSDREATRDVKQVLVSRDQQCILGFCEGEQIVVSGVGRAPLATPSAMRLIRTSGVFPMASVMLPRMGIATSKRVTD